MIAGSYTHLDVYKRQAINELMFKEVEVRRVLVIAPKRVAAQCRVAEFYKKQGYMELNDIHMDEDCPHTWMRKEV